MNGGTPLQWAARHGHKHVAEMLVLCVGAAVDAKDRGGWTPLHWATRHGHKQVADFLLGVGAPVDAKDKGGWTPLHWAADFGHKEVAEVLIGANAAVHAKDKGRWTPLHWAARHGHRQVAEVLLDADAAVDAKAKDGSTPLHFAVSKGHRKVGEALLCASAAVDERDNKGDTSLQLAVRSHELSMVRLLLMWGADPEGLYPSRSRASMSSKAAGLRAVFVNTVPMTKQQRVAVKAERRAVVSTANTVRAVTDSTPAALVALQGAYDGYVADPTTLSVDVLEKLLTPPRDRDVRWHVLSHRVLLFAARAGLFTAETSQEAGLRRQFWFERVYQSALKVLTNTEYAIFDALVRVAEVERLVEPYHVSVAVMGLELYTFIVEEVAGVYRRLFDLEQSITHSVQQLREQLRMLGQYMLAK